MKRKWECNVCSVGCKCKINDCYGKPTMCLYGSLYLSSASKANWKEVNK